MKKQLLKSIISVAAAVCLVFFVMTFYTSAKTYGAGDTVVTLDDMFAEEENALIKPVAKLLDFNTIKVLENWNGSQYTSRYSGVGFQKAGVNSIPYAGVNLSAPNQCGGVMITAPVSGSYRLTGRFNRHNDSTDAAVFTKSWVYAYLNDGGDYLFSEKFWRTENGVSCDVTFNMDKGDKLYVLSDPNGGENAWWEDFCYFMELKLVLNSTEKENAGEREYRDGDQIGSIDTVFDRDMNYEGSLMVPVIKYLAFDNQIKPMTYYPANSSYGESSCSIFKEGTNGEPYAGTNFGAGNMAVGFMFTAPKTLEYTLKGLFNRKHDSTDGNTFTESYIVAYIGGREDDPIFSSKFWKTPGGISCNECFTMEKGDVLYVFSDPNGGDNAWWEDCCYIMELSLTVGDNHSPQTTESSGETDTTQPPETDSISDTTSGTDKTETMPETEDSAGISSASDETGNGNTADSKIVLPIVVGAVAAAVLTVVIILVARKKKGVK